MNIYPSTLPHQLDFHIIQEKLTSFCYGKNAKTKASSLLPSIQVAQITQWLEETNEYLLSIYHGDTIAGYQYPEIDKELHLLSIQEAVLQSSQFHHLRNLLRIANECILFFSDKEDVYPYLRKVVSHLTKETQVIEQIDQIIDKDGVVKDDASEALQHIRSQLKENRLKSDRLYRSHIQRLKKLGYLAEFDESFVNNRRVLCVLAEHKRDVKGIILGQSATGKITFIEPQNVIELNNERIQFEDDEKKEITKILKLLSEYCRPFAPTLSAYYYMLSNLDYIAAKAKLAKELNATKPIVHSQEKGMILVNAFHPVLFLQNQNDKKTTIPIHCELKNDRRIMIISGPNAGGKSITLKTIGLLQLMLQCGLLLPASAKSEFSICKNMFGDIGDHQSIEDGLSTYSSRLIKMKYFLTNTDADTLFLIDEFGTGSDPDMGGAMAEVILDKLNATKALGVATTHFTNLKLFANHQEGIFNACMLFNSKNLKPLYELHIGEPGSSFTFEVAEKIGLPQDIIQEAKSKLSKEKLNMDKLLNQLQVEKNGIARLKKDLQKQMSKTTAEKREFQSLNSKIEDNLQKQSEQKEERQKLMELGKKLAQLTQEWSNSKNKKDVISKFVKIAGYEQFRKKEQEEFERTEAYRQKKLIAMKSKIEVGTKVRMLKSKEIGVIRELKENRALVQFGRVEMNVGIEKLEIAII